jgi:hypothetical protein
VLDVCQHAWAEDWFTVSARIVRSGKPTFVVANARLQRCMRCESFVIEKELIARRLFRAADGPVLDVLIRSQRDERPHQG